MLSASVSFFFNDTATTEIYTLSLHDALPICRRDAAPAGPLGGDRGGERGASAAARDVAGARLPQLDLQRDQDLDGARGRSEEHTSELQSRQYLVCRLLLEKKKNLNICLNDNC